MKKLLHYVPAHILLFLILGILTQYYSRFWQFNFLPIIVFFIIGVVLIFITKNKVIVTFLCGILFFFVGVCAVYLNNDRNYDSYYEKHVSENSLVFLQIRKVLKSSSFHYKYEAEVIQVEENFTRGKILLNIKKDSLSKRLKVDELITTTSNFKAIDLPKNPNQFNYKNYLANQGIYKQLFLEKNMFLKLKSNSFSLIGIAAKIRDKIQKSLEKEHFSEEELSIIEALLLGQKQNLSNELRNNYANAGAIHILAVSGLHIGILLLILSYLLKPLEFLKWGFAYKAISILVLLWVFAFIAGLSASVVRAVTMFSFITFGQLLQRKGGTEFSLVTSMILVLMIHPLFLFDIGFQLSYLAVFAIIGVQPKFVKLWKPKNKIFHFFWNLITVSLAAQLGVLPLSLFYFQQFPSLFLISNLVILPCLGIILTLGIITVILSLLNGLPSFLVFIYGKIITLMNTFVSWISNQEAFLFEEISISFLMMVSCYLFLIFGVRFFFVKTPKKLSYFLISLLVLQLVFLVEKFQKEQQEEFIIFHKTKYSIIGKRKVSHLFLQYQKNVDPYFDYSLQSYRILEKIDTIQKANFKNVLAFKNNTILIVDSLGSYAIKSRKKPIVVLQYSPQINAKRMIKTIQPFLIIADGSNYKSYVNQWRKSAEQKNILFYDTAKNGAYILRK